MIVADSSVWIDYFNGRATAAADALDRALQHDQVLMLDLILMEILQGFRLDAHYQQARAALGALPCAQILTPQKAVEYAELYRALRKRGITIRKNHDMMIAGYCLSENIPLLFDDRDFLPFVQHLGLKSENIQKN